MANANTPMGLRPVGTIGSAGYCGRVEKFFSSTSETAAIGIGDPVALAGSADADGVPTAIRMTAGGTAVGVVVGTIPDPSNLNTANYKPANTAKYLLVDTDPNTVYEVQETSAAATTYIAAASVGLNATLSLGTVDTTTGNGKTVLTTTVATTTTLDVQILRLAPTVGNAIGQYARWLVRLNNNQYKANATGI